MWCARARRSTSASPTLRPGSSPEPSRSPTSAAWSPSRHFRSPTVSSSAPWSGTSFRSLDLAVTIWAPLGGGLLTGRYGTDRERPEDTRLAGIGGRHEENTLSRRNLAVADAVNAVASEQGIGATQVAIAWVLAQRRRRGVVIPIVGARTEAQVRDNLGALEVKLTAVELGRLDAASQVAPGFPHDFGGARLAYGDTLGLIDDHRALVDPLV